MNITLFALCSFVSLGLLARTVSADEGEQVYYYAEAAKYAEPMGGHAVLILIDGKVVFEEYQNGYAADKATQLASATKSFWGPVVVAMIEDGLVSSFDEKVSDTITEWKKDSVKSPMTIRNLLDLTAGLAQDVHELQGLRGSAEDMYEYAIGLRSVTRPGERFQYGPASYYVLGALISRKIQGKYDDPVEYLAHRIFDPLGIRIADWERDPAGNPHIPNGASMTARDWARYGQFLLQGGNWEGKQIIPRDLLEQCSQKSAVNPGYGLTFWLNNPGGFGERLSSPAKTPGGVIYPDGHPDIYAALGAGTNDLFIVPSLRMVIVHQSVAEGTATRKARPEAVFSRAKFLSLLFTGQAATMTEPEIIREFPGAEAGRSSKTSPSDDVFTRLDRNQDGRVTIDEIPDRLTKMKDNFSLLDRNHDGYLTPDELDKGN